MSILFPVSPPEFQNQSLTPIVLLAKHRDYTMNRTNTAAISHHSTTGMFFS